MANKAERLSLPVVTIAVIATLGLAAVPLMNATVRTAVSGLHIEGPLGVSGLVLTVGGFAIIVWQLVRTQLASRAAAQAVLNLKFRLAGLEDTALCRDCIGSANEIERQHIVSIGSPSAQSFVVLPEIYRALRLNLTAFRSRRPSLWSAEQNQIAQEALAKLEDAESSVLKYIAKPTTKPPDLQPLQAAIRRLSSVLTLMSVNLSKVAIGETNDQR